MSPPRESLCCRSLDAPWPREEPSELASVAWPPRGGPRSVDNQVLTLRRKLEQAGLGEGGGIPPFANAATASAWTICQRPIQRDHQN